MEPGRGFGEVPGWRENVIRRAVCISCASKRARGPWVRSEPRERDSFRSCEGHLVDGRHLGSSCTALFHESMGQATSASLFTVSRHVTEYRPARSCEHEHAETPARRRGGVRRSKRKRQGCQRYGLLERHGSNTPALFHGRSAEAVAGVVKHPFPWSCCVEPRLHAASTQRKPRSLPGTHEVRVHTIVRVADVDRTHRASSTPRGRKTPRRTEGASQKEARSPRLTRGAWGERAKRCASSCRFDFRSSSARFVGFGSRALETKEGILGPVPCHLHR